MINFYRRFIPNAAGRVLPLTRALRGKPKRLEWTEEMEEAFINTKNTLASSTLLVHPRANAPLQLVTDASTKALGAVLQQMVEGKPQPLAFYSRRTSEAESKYSPYDLELLSIYTAIIHFRHMLEGRNFTIFTDQNRLPVRS